jgi:GDP-L-fucose synthase
MSGLITPADRIFVAGHRGMAGSAICRALEQARYGQVFTAIRDELDLLDGTAVQRWFAEQRPTLVVLAAASGFAGSFQLETSRPNGNERKLLDVIRLASLGRLARLPLA